MGGREGEDGEEWMGRKGGGRYGEGSRMADGGERVERI